MDQIHNLFVWRYFSDPFTGDTVSFYYCGGTLTWSYEGALILLKKTDNMPKVMKNSDFLIAVSASVTGFDAWKYCELEYTGKSQKFCQQIFWSKYLKETIF